MIRVTFKEDGKKLEYEIATYLNKAIYVTTKRKMNFVGYPLENVVKIEKQVKDLTLEECRKLGLTETFAFEWGFGLDRGSISNDFRDEDYIDITAIVKGQVE